MRDQAASLGWSERIEAGFGRYAVGLFGFDENHGWSPDSDSGISFAGCFDQWEFGMLCCLARGAVARNAAAQRLFGRRMVARKPF